MNKKTIQEFKSRQHMITNDYEIYHYRDIGFYNVSMHHHDFYELYFLISGSVDYYIDGRIHPVKPGNLVLINTTELHQIKINAEEKTYERIVLWIGKEFLKSLSSTDTDLTYCFKYGPEKPVIYLEHSIKLEIHNNLEKILNLDSFKGKGKEILSSAYIMELMVNVNNIVDKKTEYYIYNTKSSLIESVVEYIGQNLHEDITISILSEKFFISKYHLSREFKKYMQITLHKYITLKRLIKAKELIGANMPITEVYIKSGFGDYSNFFRAFKNEYKITPKQYYNIVTNKDKKAKNI